MRKGQIVRRMSNDGTPYGPYLMVDRATVNKIDAHPIDPVSNFTVTLDKNHVYECATVMLDAPVQDIIRIIENDANVYYHEPTKKWLHATHYNWDIIVIKNNSVGIKVYYTGVVERVMKRKVVDVKNRYKQQIKWVPIIRVTFERMIHAITRDENS